MKENFTSIPSRSRPRLFLGCPARLELGNFASQPRDLLLLRLHLPLAGECVLRIVPVLLHPVAQLRLMHTNIGRCLCVGNASILDQAHCLKLELSRELP